MRAVLIAARNEERTIAGVVNAAMGWGDIVIVANDGSEDQTGTMAARYGAQVINTLGGGKFHAIAEAQKRAGLKNGDIICLLDGDLLGVLPQHIAAMEARMIFAQADMCVGLINWEQVIITSSKSGQRVLTKAVLDRTMAIGGSGYGLEKALEAASAKRVQLYLDGITHRTKSQKVGPLKAVSQWWKMVKEAT